METSNIHTLFLKKAKQKRSLERKYEEQPRIAVDGTEHTVRSADKKILHRKLVSTPIASQRSPKKDLFPNMHKLRGLGVKYVSASERTRLMEEGIISESKPKVRKVNSDEEDNDFECYDTSEGRPLHVDFDKDILEGNKPTLVLLPNRSEEDEINNNGKRSVRDGKINLRRLNRIFRSPERLGSVPYFGN